MVTLFSKLIELKHFFLANVHPSMTLEYGGHKKVITLIYMYIYIYTYIVYNLKLVSLSIYAVIAAEALLIDFSEETLSKYTIALHNYVYMHACIFIYGGAIELSVV